MLKKGTIVYSAFSGYAVEKQISQGGNGKVFLVHNEKGEKFALKAIDRNMTTSDKLKRFKNEISFCENNTNPHIIKILDHGTYWDDNVNLVFYIMPVYNMTLRDMMNEGIEPEKVLPLITQILSGLRYAHEKGVWHRDIKPENILIDRQGKLVIADFGIAHFSADDLATIIETRKTDRLANFQYAAPEQRVRNGKVDGRADIYALGLIMNEMFTKTLPIGTNYTKIGDVNRNYSWLDSVVDLMLQQKPEERPYPTSNIATRILAAQNEWSSSQELLHLSEEKPNDEEPYQMELPTIRDCQYDRGELKIYLDGMEYYWFEVWFGILQSGQYPHGEVIGYGPNKLRHYAPDCISMPLSISSESQLTTIARHIKNWLIGATQIFNKEQLEEHNREMNTRRQKKEAEIQKLKEEERMRMAVKGLFDKI